MNAIRHIVIIYKARHTGAKQAALDIRAQLNKKNVSSALFPADVLEEHLAPEIDRAQAVVVLGGDGTFIGTARKLVDKNIPLLGINFGQLGFLLEFSLHDLTRTIERLCAQKLPIQKKTVLSWSVIRNDTVIKSGFAINDIVVGRGSLARLLPIRLALNKRLLGVVRSDGVLVSTPTGTSAYAVSAYGPLVHPEIPALTLISISTLFKSPPPLVIPFETLVEIKPLHKHTDAFLTIDGQEGIVIQEGEHVAARALNNNFLMYATPNYNYFQQIQKKSLILPKLNDNT